jgi:hypothetical protein
MDPIERLRKAGWTLTQISGFLANCEAGETLDIGKADTGAELRSVLDRIADRQAKPKESEEE